MSAAAQFAKAGHRVVILNRDCKVGGLAEYGIFPSKHRLRTGLQKNLSRDPLQTQRPVFRKRRGRTG
jgi:hypothetical protein